MMIGDKEGLWPTHDGRWLDEMLDKMDREGGFTVTDVMVTPGLARALLDRAAPNRKMKPRHLVELRRALQRGRWLNTGHPIVIGADRKVWDGQHRLRMIISEGKPATIDLRFGVNPMAFQFMDNGARRSGADTLYTAGIDNQKLVSATARMVRALHASAIAAAEHSFTNYGQNDEMLQFVRDNPTIEDAARIGGSTAGAFREMVGVPATPLAAAAFLISEEHGIDVAEAFFEEIRRGGAVANVALSALRDLIHSKKYAGRVGLVAAVILAWNHQKAGLKRKPTLKLVPGMGWPKVM